MAEGEERWLLDEQMSNTRKFVNDFVSYVMLTVRDIEWQGDGADEEATEHFTPEIGDFLMGMSAEERRGYSESIAEAFNEKDFSLSNYSRDFRESFAHLFFPLGYTSASAMHKMFGYTAEAALAFSEIPQSRGIQVAATALSDFLTHSYLPLFAKFRSLTLISFIKTEMETYTSAMWDVYSYLAHEERKYPERRLKTNEEVLREYVIEEVSDEEWEEMKKRWLQEQEMLVQQAREEAVAQEREAYRQHVDLTTPPDAETWKEAYNETWRFVGDCISYMVSRLKGSTWQWRKGKEPSPYFTNDVGRNLYAFTREVRRTYAEQLQEFYQSERFDLNKYPELFYEYAVQLFRYSYGPLNMIRVFNMFGYTAEAAAVFSEIERGRGIELVAITLSRFTIGVILRSLLAEGGYMHFVKSLEDMPGRMEEGRESIDEYRAFLREQRALVLRARAERQQAKIRELGLLPEKPVLPPKKSQVWNLKQRWENEPQRWFPAQMKLQPDSGNQD